MYHLWYIPMTIGLYLFIPFFKHIINNIPKKLLEYFILFLIFFSMLIPTLNLIPAFKSTFSFVFENLFLGFSISEYITYLVIGYYINNFPIKPFIKKLIYVLSVLSAFFTVLATGLISYIRAEEYVALREYYTLNVLFLSCGLFLFIKEKYQSRTFSDKAKKIITDLSKKSFGIYLIHIMILELAISLLEITISPLAFIVYFVVTLICSYIITSIISRIKFLNQYII